MGATGNENPAKGRKIFKPVSSPVLRQRISWSGCLTSTICGGPTMVRTTWDWEAELRGWLEPFLKRLGHKARRRMCPLYVAGLIGPGDRKSVQPMAECLAPNDYDQLHLWWCLGCGAVGERTAHSSGWACRRQRCGNASLPSWPSWLSKTCLKSDHFSGGVSRARSPLRACGSLACIPRPKNPPSGDLKIGLKQNALVSLVGRPEQVRAPVPLDYSASAFFDASEQVVLRDPLIEPELMAKARLPAP
jgi:hypothetical protein